MQIEDNSEANGVKPSLPQLFRFSLRDILLIATVICAWLATLKFSLELCVGISVMTAAIVTTRFRYRAIYRAGILGSQEALVIGGLFFLGFGLVARFLAEMFSR